MAPSDLLIHLLSFLAPALGVALLVALAGRLLVIRQSGRRPWWAHAAINSLAGTGVLLAGLWWWGVDGKMATYSALVLVIATCQWLFSGAWRH
ncbi:MAG: hypothetical protein JWP43_3245 [Ramlibacter sp.]|jgi:hypothetical protein|nr:hypothetical protein [Ramlibacter sp.]